MSLEGTSRPTDGAALNHESNQDIVIVHGNSHDMNRQLPPPLQLPTHSEGGSSLVISGKEQRSIMKDTSKHTENNTDSIAHSAISDLPKIAAEHSSASLVSSQETGGSRMTEQTRNSAMAHMRWNDLRSGFVAGARAAKRGNEPGTLRSRLKECERREQDRADTVAVNVTPAPGARKGRKSILRHAQPDAPDDAPTDNDEAEEAKAASSDTEPNGQPFSPTVEKRVRFALAKDKPSSRTSASVFRLPRIRPQSDSAVQYWNLAFVFPLTYETWAFPFRLALGSPDRSGLFAADLACDCWFLLDAVVCCCVEVPHEGELTHRELLLRYLKHTFPRELLPSIVFLSLSTSHTPLWAWWLLGIPRLVPRMMRFRGYFKAMEMNLEVAVDQLQLLKFALTIFLACHWVGCVFYWMARVMGFEDNTWVGQFELTMPGVFDREESPVAQHYLACLYRGWIGLAPNSYRRPPQNWPEQLFSVAVMFMAMYLSAYLIGTVLPYIVKKDPVLEEHKKRRMDFLIFANQHQLPQDIVARGLEYHEYQYAKMSASAGSLSVQLTRTLEVKVAKKRFGPYIDRCSQKGMIFAKCNAGFLGSLVSKLKEVYIMPGEELIRAGDVARELYFVADGAIQLVQREAVLKEIRGDVADMECVVGELSFFLGVPQAHAARASTDSDARVLVLSMEDSEKLLALYPEHQDMILKNILHSYNLDMHGKDVQVETEEQQYDVELRAAIVSALKRREDEAFAALNFAAAMGDVEEMQRLIRRKCDVNAANYDGRTVLHMACHDGSMRIVELLLDGGAEKQVKSRWGVTPLMEAIYAKQHQCVHTLLSYGAEMLLDDPSGTLCDWASRGELDNLKLLLANNVDPNVGDYDRRTPLHLAASEGQDKVVELLMSFGADVNAQDRWAGTPLKDAVVSNHAVIASVLRNKGGKMPPGVGVAEFCAGASMGDVAKLRMLHSCGVDPDAGDYDARTALHLGCAEARLLVVSFLVGVSATINIKDRWGATPLDECVKGGTKYHLLCGKILMGWGGRLGVLEGTAEGRRGLEQIAEVDVDEVSRLIRHLIASGLYDKRQPTCTGQELLVAKEASQQLLRDGGDLHEQVEPWARELEAALATVQHFGSTLELLLLAIAGVLDSNPLSYALAILNRERPDSVEEEEVSLEDDGAHSPARMPSPQPGRAAPVDEIAPPPRRGGTSRVLTRDRSHLLWQHTRRASMRELEGEGRKHYRQQMEEFIAETSKSSLDPDTLLGLDDAEQDALERLYAELDELLALQQQSQLLGASERALKAKNLNHSLMRLCELEDVLENLTDAFRRFGGLPAQHHPQQRSSSGLQFLSASGRSPMVDANALVQVLDSLGVDGVDMEEAQQMVNDAADHPTSHSGRAGPSGLLASSKLFRSKLYVLDGAGVGGPDLHFTYLSKCPVLSSLPFACLRRLSEAGGSKHCNKGDVLWAAGSVPSALCIVKSGGFVLQGSKDPETRRRECVEVSSESVVGMLEFYTNEKLAYSVFAAQDSELIQVPSGQLTAMLQADPRLCYRMARALVHALRDGTDRTHAGDVRPVSDSQVREAADLIMQRFRCAPTSPRKPAVDTPGTPGSPVTSGDNVGWGTDVLRGGLLPESTDVLLQDLRPGLKLVEESWQLFAGGASIAPVSHFRGIKEHLGEVGTRFFEIVFEVIEAREEVMAEMHIDDWWECWIRYLSSTNEMNKASTDDEEEADDAHHELPHPLQLPGALELLQASWKRARFRKLLRSMAQDKYEAAYLDLKGDLVSAIPVEQVGAYVAMLLSISEPEIEDFMLYEFLKLFGKKGIKSRDVSWFGIRKCLVDHAGRAKAAWEGPLMPGSSVFNPASPWLQVWFYLVRAVALYHFLLVPVRLVYRPFHSPSDIALLCSDLVADTLVAFNVLVSFNTSYLSKKSRWVTARTKIARKYLASFCYLDVIAAVPVDWILMLAFDIDIAEASWTRVLKMFFVRRAFSGFGYNRSTPKGLAWQLPLAFMMLHLSACLWSGLGLSDGLGFTLDGHTWLTADSSQAFLEGMEPGGDGRLSMWHLYTTSVNWVATHTVSAVGNSTIYPKNYLEVIFAMCQLTVGMTFYRMVIGQISTRVMKSDEKIIKVRGQLSSLESYIEKNHIAEDESLSNEIRKHFHALQSLQVVDMAEVFAHLSSSLQFDISNLVCRDAVVSAELFSGCSQSMLDQLSVRLRQVQFGPEEELFHAGDVPEDLYLVVAGAVERCNVDGSGEEVALGATRAGGSVGDVSFAFGMKHLYGARASALRGATCLRLGRAAYLQILKLYPEDADMVAQNSLNAFEKAKVEHGSSRAGSKKGASVNGDGAGQETVVEEDKSFASDDLSESRSGAGSDAFEDMIGAGIAQHIYTLRRRQASTRVLHLLQAAHSNDRHKIQKLLNRGVSINDADPNKRTALHLACSEGHTETVLLLLQQGADSTAKDCHGNTPLNDAVRHKRDAVCALMREMLPGCHAVFPGKMAAVQLCQAACAGDLDTVERLLDSGVGVNEADYDQRTALHLAACEGHTEVVQVLLRRKADFNARDRFSGTALQDAVRHGHEAVQTVLRERSKNIVGMDTAVSMCAAAAKGDLHHIRTLVENGVDPNLPDYDKRTAMHLAASNGRVEVLNYLLELEPACNVNPVDVTGGTPLEDAIRHGKNVTRKMLEEAGGLRKGDPGLAASEKEQAQQNLRHQRQMRGPQVASAYQRSTERQQAPSVEGFLRQLSGALPPEQHGGGIEQFGLMPRTGSDDPTHPPPGSLPALLKRLDAAIVRFTFFAQRVLAALQPYQQPEELLQYRGRSGSTCVARLQQEPEEEEEEEDLTVLPGVVTVAASAVEESDGTSSGGSGPGFRILSELLAEGEELCSALASAYRDLPPLPALCAPLRLFARRYADARAALHLRVLYATALANRLRSLARQHHQRLP